MPRTAESLIEACFLDDLNELTDGAMCDYFGKDKAFSNMNMQNNSFTEYHIILFGTYQFLIKKNMVSSNELHQACLNNKLNELIHDKYKNCDNEYYYTQFKKRDYEL